MTRRTGEALQPRAAGTGLVALDIIVKSKSKEPPRFCAGGTCGNVLTALSYLSWSTSPIARFAPGPVTKRLLADLRSHGVSTAHIVSQESGSTPIIIHRIATDTNGTPRHSFSLRCPICGSHFPGYKPLLASAALELADVARKAQVFFFDRVSRGAIHLAQAASDGAAVVVFEPSGIGDPNLFREAWALAHVVKYSHERLRDIADLDLTPSERDHVLLEVETLGSEGLRYRSRLPKCPSKGWQRIGALKPLVFKDAGGAGDWCTAGIIDSLARGGLRAFEKSGKEKVQDALLHGQALAAWNCGFEGARGGMYSVDKKTFKRQVRTILEGRKDQTPTPELQDTWICEAIAGICPSCNDAHHKTLVIAAPKGNHRKSG